jgi:hypothetical protein
MKTKEHKEMNQDSFISISVTVASVVSIFYIPKKSYRLALVSFLACQVFSWPMPLIFTQIGYMAFPARMFMHATKINFIVLYLFFPMVFAWFMLLFPQKASIWRKAVHYFIFVSIIVWSTYYMSVYTHLQEFLKGTMQFNVAVLYLRIYMYTITSHLFIKWFSKRTNVLAGGLNA